MQFASDNAGPAHPQVLAAMSAANEGYASPYGADAVTARVTARLREIFEAPEASVHLVATGTAANALALATLAQPWQAIFCTPVAHIHEDECNAPEFYSGGAKLALVGEGDRMTPEALHAAIAAEESRGVHGPQRGPVSITQATERGGVYDTGEIAALGAVARDFGLKMHLDGARFANALVALNASPAEMTWKAGVDAVSFGASKNGCPGVEAVIFFDPEVAWEFELRRKRGGHLFSKYRYLAAQLEGYLADGLWLESARRANAACARLAEGLRALPGVSFLQEPRANMLFPRMPRAMHRRLMEAGAQYYLWEGALEGDDPEEPLTARLVCDWSIPDAEIDRFVEIARG
ncbi:threonine aldolase family protein [Rhodosalinus sediminis]|jgi:threonine aldolase|uniref:threonine aldolase family protein n=1 Tax=Rhodosalinus sediminis TaxID=1940533 RepID=UPI0023544401|nr:beta-eliminating lyase-related protein [Rhodosalinus sediminis]